VTMMLRGDADDRPRTQAEPNRRRSAIATAAPVIPADRVAATRAASIEIARLMSDTKCANVRVLDVTGLSPVCDFIVLGTGTSTRQMKTVADDVAEWGEEHGLRSFGKAGTGENWIALDLVDVVVHVFSQEGRHYYDLENLWGDATDVAWKRDA
jgi:ribosome-associated protein